MQLIVIECICRASRMHIMDVHHVRENAIARMGAVIHESVPHSRKTRNWKISRKFPERKKGHKKKMPSPFSANTQVHMLPLQIAHVMRPSYASTQSTPSYMWLFYGTTHSIIRPVEDATSTASNIVISNEDLRQHYMVSEPNHPWYARRPNDLVGCKVFNTMSADDASRYTGSATAWVTPGDMGPRLSRFPRRAHLQSVNQDNQ